jgi:hypothetical protein
MAFDAAKFSRLSLSPRTARVHLPALAGFFEKGEKPEFEVRGLEGVELSRCHDAVRTNRDIAELAGQILAGDSADKVTAIREAMGIGERVPDEIAKRVEMLVIGSVEPKLDREAALKLCKALPIEFYQLTNEITRLTGEGARLGESTGSGASRPSKQPVPSGGSKAAASSS